MRFNQFEGDEVLLSCDNDFEETYSVKSGLTYMIYSHDNTTALICNNCGEIIEIPIDRLAIKPLNLWERVLYFIFNWYW